MIELGLYMLIKGKWKYTAFKKIVTDCFAAVFNKKTKKKTLILSVVVILKINNLYVFVTELNMHSLSFRTFQGRDKEEHNFF